MVHDPLRFGDFSRLCANRPISQGPLIRAELSMLEGVARRGLHVHCNYNRSSSWSWRDIRTGCKKSSLLLGCPMFLNEYHMIRNEYIFCLADLALNLSHQLPAHTNTVSKVMQPKSCIHVSIFME